MIRQHRQDRLAATTWWFLGLSLALAASLASGFWVLIGLCLASLMISLVFAKPEQRYRAVPLYLGLALFVVLVRLAFRIVFNQPGTGTVVFSLPQVTLEILGTQISLLGPVSSQSLSAAAIDGLRLAGIVLGIGMANTLANPRKLLKSTPPALYELATAAAVAINLAPELIQSLQRVRLAMRLRGQEARWWRVGYLMVPVLEDTIERSLKLAAGMDARGFGKTPTSSRGTKIGFQALSITALICFAWVGYLALASQNPIWVLGLVASLGLASLAGSIHLAGKSRVRTRYPGQPKTWLDWVVGLVALLILGVFLVNAPNTGALMQWIP